MNSAEDDTRWVEQTDTAWAARCRRQQVWWRENVLGVPPGPISAARPDRLVGSMLPLDCDRSLNFLAPSIVDAVEARLAEGDHSGKIDQDRLFRNLLSSQPACFNLFGPFVANPGALLSWVRTIDNRAETIRAVRFEWAPDRRRHFDGGSAFDAFITYDTLDERCFLGVECKYAENLAVSTIRVRQPYIDFTTPARGWRDDAAQELNAASTRQFWLNTLLAQSLVERESDYQRGAVVVVACAADETARQVAAYVRGQLLDPDRWLHFSTYEMIVASVSGYDDWRRAFTARYLPGTDR